MTLDVPRAWSELADRLLHRSWRRLVVLGRTDAGKSSFCRYLSGQLAERGLSVALLDTDLGQKMVGPPACVTLESIGADGRGQLQRIRFVGDTSPVANLLGVVAAAARLAHMASADRLLVNTSGLVTGAGIALKRWKLDALDPDHVVAIAWGDELDPILAPLPRVSVHQLRPSSSARRKSAAVRERNRRDALLAALGPCRPLALPTAVTEELLRTAPATDQLRLCGLADESGEDRGIGLVRWSDFVEGHQVWTSLDPADGHRIRLGMALSDLGEVPGPFHRAD